MISKGVPFLSNSRTRASLLLEPRRFFFSLPLEDNCSGGFLPFTNGGSLFIQAFRRDDEGSPVPLFLFRTRADNDRADHRSKSRGHGWGLNPDSSRNPNRGHRSYKGDHCCNGCTSVLSCSLVPGLRPLAQGFAHGLKPWLMLEYW